MGEAELVAPTGAWESRAIFAAILAACQGKDQEAAEILRSIAETMKADALKKGGRVSGRTEGARRRG